MPSATMWWAKTNWSFPNTMSVTSGPGGLSVSGRVDGPPGGFLSLGEKSATFSVLAQYWLGTDRMPTGGCTFQSATKAQLTGDLVGLTFGGIWLIGPDPTTTCKLIARQLVFSGGTLIASSQADSQLISIVDDDFQLVRVGVPSNPFFPVNFDLRRDQTLSIHLELLFHMFFRGDGIVRFSPFLDSPPFLISLPQWDIVSIT